VIVVQNIKINLYHIFPDPKIERVTKHPHRICNLELCMEFIAKSCPSFKFNYLTGPHKSIFIFNIGEFYFIYILIFNNMYWVKLVKY